MLKRMPGNTRSVRAGAALSIFLCLPLCAQTLQHRLVHDASDGRLDSFDFVSACLIAGGVEDECELEGWAITFQEKQAAILAKLGIYAGQSRVEELHGELRREFLTGQYDPEASDLRGALAGREYNCLSSVALMYSLAVAAELNAEIHLAPGHVNLVVTEAWQPPVVVEPTASSPGESAESTATGRVLAPVELLGKFYYNRGVELLRREEYAGGLQLLAISMRLDADDRNARTNFVAGVNNWAAAHCAAGNLQRAAELVALGLKLDADFAPLRANQLLIRAKMGR